MTKKIVSVPVTLQEPKLQKYNFSNDYYIYYGAKVSFYPESDVADIAKRMADIQKTYGDTFDNLRFVEERDCGCYSYDCGCSPSYVLYGSRLELDIEYDYRIDNERKAKEQKEARERAQYEALKKKFD